MVVPEQLNVTVLFLNYSTKQYSTTLRLFVFGITLCRIGTVRNLSVAYESNDSIQGRLNQMLWEYWPVPKFARVKAWQEQRINLLVGSVKKPTKLGHHGQKSDSGDIRLANVITVYIIQPCFFAKLTAGPPYLNDSRLVDTIADAGMADEYK